MENRIGIIGLVIEKAEKIDEVNTVLHEYANFIHGRMGLPYKDRGFSVITLVIDATNDTISALTGKLGRLDGVLVKSMLTKSNNLEGNL